MVNINVNGKDLSVTSGTTILKAAEQSGIPIPHLCFLKEINEIAACRMCVVEVEGTERLVPACNTEAMEGMVIHTNSPRVRQARKTNLRLILSQHNSNCTVCVRSGNCELQKLSHDLNIHFQPYPVHLERSHVDLTAPIVREASKCIKCMRCVQVCNKIQGMNIWDVTGTGSRTTVDVSYNRTLKSTSCTYCGQCVTHCPTGALTVRDDTNRALRALADPEITTVVQVAPAVRVAWAEAFGLPKRQATTGRMVAALKRIGFDYVFDTNFAADLTIMEEGSELLERLSVSAIALPDVEEDSPLRREILTLAEEKGIPLWWVRRDTTVELEKGQLTLYPPLGAGEANELGLSVLAGAGGLDLLVTGDMSGDVEGMLVEHAGLRDVELLVAGHHGSASSTSQALLNALQPETAILSVGRDNAYGPPAPETLERLERAGAEIYRTDRDGTVTVRTR